MATATAFLLDSSLELPPVGIVVAGLAALGVRDVESRQAESHGAPDPLQVEANLGWDSRREHGLAAVTQEAGHRPVFAVEGELALLVLSRLEARGSEGFLVVASLAIGRAWVLFVGQLTEMGVGVAIAAALEGDVAIARLRRTGQHVAGLAGGARMGPFEQEARLLVELAVCEDLDVAGATLGMAARTGAAKAPAMGIAVAIGTALVGDPFELEIALGRVLSGFRILFGRMAAFTGDGLVPSYEGILLGMRKARGRNETERVVALFAVLPELAAVLVEVTGGALRRQAEVEGAP